jgi:DNA-binding MarR family transcriptional regulator
MARADGKLFRLLTDDVCRDLLRLLLCSKDPQTQGQLALELGLNSSTVSRRMRVLEDAALVTRATPHAPYELLFPQKTRELLAAGVDLAALALSDQAAQAQSDAQELRKEGMAGGLLLDHAKEGA